MVFSSCRFFPADHKTASRSCARGSAGESCRNSEPATTSFPLKKTKTFKISNLRLVLTNVRTLWRKDSKMFDNNLMLNLNSKFQKVSTHILETCQQWDFESKPSNFKNNKSLTFFSIFWMISKIWLTVALFSEAGLSQRI